jgi:hypothetical protein
MFRGGEFRQDLEQEKIHGSFIDPSRVHLERKIGQLTLENDFLKKAFSISGSITRQPSSVAPLRVPRDRASRPRRCVREAAVRAEWPVWQALWYISAAPGTLLRIQREEIARQQDSTDQLQITAS